MACLIARASLPPGMVVADGVDHASSAFRPGHKVAIRPIAVGEPIRRYGQIIGFATIADRARPARPHPELRHGRFRQGLCVRRRRQAGAEFRPARDLRGHPPSRRAGRDPQLYRHPDLGELQRACRRPGRRCLQEESVHARQSAGGFSQCRRRGGADPQDRLRHDAGRAAGAAAPHPRRLCAACEFFRRDRAGPGLRGQPDRRA